MTSCKECGKRNSCQKPLSMTGNYKDCKNFEQKRLTHFEKIKQMSFDEFVSLFDKPACNICACGYTLICDNRCQAHIKEWLMEVEGEK